VVTLSWSSGEVVTLVVRDFKQDAQVDTVIGDCDMEGLAERPLHLVAELSEQAKHVTDVL
jgi:hypothetical protein